jgi:PleD family two-component response regulator
MAATTTEELRMKSDKPTILLADDDPAIVRLLRHQLARAGFEIVAAHNGREALGLAAAANPDLFLLDVMMPEMDGLEVCRRLKNDVRVCRVPVIFITGMDETSDVLAGFEAGGADYIRKPFHRAEVLARVKTHLQLYHSMLELERLRQLALDASPSTGLPGNNSINEAVSRALAQKSRLSVLYTDLDNFKAYNDKYGFARGDLAIKFTANVILESVEQICGPGCFIGHIGGDDFAVLAPSPKADKTAREIIKRFDAGAPGLYDPADAALGRISALDRQGQRRDFPIMTISIAGVDLVPRGFEHYLEVSNVCAELKKASKAVPESCVFFDRRQKTRGKTPKK